MTVDNIVKVLLCILAVLLAYAFANIYATQYIKLNDWGVWANWAGALANWLVAIATLVAVFNVKSWFKEKNNSAGYDFSLKLMIDIDSTQAEQHEFYWYISSLYPNHTDLNNMYNKIRLKSFHISSLKDRADSCLRFNIKPCSDIYFYLEEMHTFYDTCLRLYGALRMEDHDEIKSLHTDLREKLEKIKKIKKHIKKEIHELFKFP
ncbi:MULTISPECIES: hypothetical protein [Serratia]|uniref:hypothetical protein n=1 Tax=Serratia TaxID=613 RepID=UPI0013DD7FEF|nr:hypothetical protein [Serratia marcescens]